MQIAGRQGYMASLMSMGLISDATPMDARRFRVRWAHPPAGRERAEWRDPEGGGQCDNVIVSHAHSPGTKSWASGWPAMHAITSRAVPQGAR